MSKSELSEDWYHMDMTLPIPISVTHEVLESGRQTKTAFNNRGFRSQVNFQAYDFKDFRLDVDHTRNKLLGKDNFITTYTRDYIQPYPSKCPPLKPIDDYIDPIFNCRPVNALKIRAHAPGKFMDDQLVEPTAPRKRKNFFRQLRASSQLW